MLLTWVHICIQNGYDTAMSAGRIDQLTEAQRASLRLVLSHHNSKEIAAIFGVSPSAIDKRIERAVQVLGVGTRFEAARRLDEHERGTSVAYGDVGVALAERETAYERLTSEPIDVADPPSHAPGSGQIEPWGLARRFLGTSSHSGSQGAARNRLSKGDRLVRLIAIMGLIAVTTMALVNMTMTLTSLFRHSRPSAPTHDAAKAVPTGGRITMLKARRTATDTVTAEFLQAEAAIDHAAQLAASCVATLLQQRAAANLPVSTGTAALQLVSEASTQIITARQRFIEAHSALVAVRREIGMGQFYGFGDEGKCPPNEGALRVETPVRLAAVA